MRYEVLTAVTVQNIVCSQVIMYQHSTLSTEAVDTSRILVNLYHSAEGPVVCISSIHIPTCRGPVFKGQNQ
jgi:hypothetical protein